jgi:glycosyltransferase involved in cell wall biosynthesis
MLISVITPCYNEAENVKEAYCQVKRVFADLGNYNYEHIFIDNASKDRTVPIR